MRLVTGCVVLGLVITGSSTAVAGPKHKAPRTRVVEVKYSTPSAYYLGPCLSCPDVSMRSWEKYFTVEVIDDVSDTGHVDVTWDTSSGHDYVVVCGGTETAQKVPARSVLTVFPWAHPSPDCGGLSTSGTLRFTFSDRP